jgi:ribosomal protein RSM22 (predicted rRNA methylase)
MDLPPDLAHALRQHLTAGSAKELQAAAAALSERYRAGVPDAIGSERDVLAYAATRLPATFAAVAAALRAVAEQRPGWSPASVLDAGAGPGTAAWAAAVTWPQIASVRHLERDRRMTALGAELSAAARHPALRAGGWEQADLTGEWQAEADLVVAAYCLNEMPEPERAGVVTRLWAAAVDTLVIVEPGTPAGYGIILEARTRLIGDGGRVVAPCTHDGPCPLSGREGDWCHFSQRLARSRLHRLIKGGDAPFEDEKFSYIALSRQAAARDWGRVIRHPFVQPGAITLEICSEAGARATVVTRRDRAAFRTARDLRWGSPVPHPLERREERRLHANRRSLF